MSVALPRVDAAMRVCRGHLDSTRSRNTEIDQILVGYVLTIVHAEWEQWLQAAVEARTVVHGDPHLAGFARYSVGRLFRKFKISDLSGLLGAFDDGCKSHFMSQVENTPAHTAYDNIERNRQLVAHQKGTGMTFAELERTYLSALPVLESFEDALNIARPSQPVSLGSGPNLGTAAAPGASRPGLVEKVRQWRRRTV